MNQTIGLHSHTSIYSQLTPDIQSKGLVTMSASLHTQNGWPNPTSQILNIRVHFIDIWYTSLSSIHYNLEHELAIVTENWPQPTKTDADVIPGHMDS